jgi:hypothetical protein
MMTTTVAEKMKGKCENSVNNPNLSDLMSPNARTRLRIFMMTESLLVDLAFELILLMNTMIAVNAAKSQRSDRMKICRVKLNMSAMIVAEVGLIRKSPVVRDARVRREATMMKKSVPDSAIRWLLAWASLRLL